MKTVSLRRALLEWYGRAARALAWRATRDPYRILVSEVMLQQTRVAAVAPYYERFLARFPDAAALAGAPESEVLALWSGLGYYARARNLQKAARQIARDGFPSDYEAIRALPGVGDYTAAAVASIAFGLPHAVLDGNVVRVLARLTDDHGEVRSPEVRRRFAALAGKLLDATRPGDFNQALMELGAVVCLPREPRCGECPLEEQCAARRAGTAHELPSKAARKEPVRLSRTVLFIERGGRILMWQRDAGARRLAGFWELPEPGQVPNATPGRTLATLRHVIVNHNYLVTVIAATLDRAPRGFRWIPVGNVPRIPLSTIARKAFLASSQGVPSSNF